MMRVTSHRKKSFVKILIKEYPKVKTIVLNVNNKKTSMALGDNIRLRKYN